MLLNCSEHSVLHRMQSVLRSYATRDFVHYFRNWKNFLSWDKDALYEWIIGLKPLPRKTLYITSDIGKLSLEKLRRRLFCMNGSFVTTFNVLGWFGYFSTAGVVPETRRHNQVLQDYEWTCGLVRLEINDFVHSVQRWTREVTIRMFDETELTKLQGLSYFSKERPTSWTAYRHFQEPSRWSMGIERV